MAWRIAWQQVFCSLSHRLMWLSSGRAVDICSVIVTCVRCKRRCSPTPLLRKAPALHSAAVHTVADTCPQILHVHPIDHWHLHRSAPRQRALHETQHLLVTQNCIGCHALGR